MYVHIYAPLWPGKYNNIVIIITHQLLVSNNLVLILYYYDSYSKLQIKLTFHNCKNNVIAIVITIEQTIFMDVRN